MATVSQVVSGRNSTGGAITLSSVGVTAGDVLYVFTSAQDSNHANMPVVSAVFNGSESFTKVRSDEAAGNVRTEIWKLENPSANNASVVVTFTGALGEATAAVVRVSGATGVEANNGATGNSTTPSVSLTTLTDNALTLSVCCAEAALTVGGGQTQQWSLTDQSYENAMGASKAVATAGAQTLSYSESGVAWAISAISIATSSTPSAPISRIGMRKRYEYKVYSKEGQYVAIWTDVANDPTFSTVINGGFVEMQIKLARKTQNFGEEVDVKFSNEVQLWCFDNDAPNGVKIFAGYVSRYDPVNDGADEYVMVYCLGFHTRLTDFMLEDSVGSTQIAYSSIDPGEIAEDVINKLDANGCPVTWDETTLQKSGTVVSYTFQANLGSEAIDKILELSPASWYWYVDANKKLNLHPKQDLPVHTFTIGKEISFIQPQKRIENVVNRIYFIGGIPAGQATALYTRYERQASIQQYGLRAIKKTDQRITLQSTMDTVAQNILDTFDNIEIRTTIRVKDNDYDRQNGYDIESIKVGDTCQIRNYQDSFASSKWDVMSWDVDYWDFNVRNLTETVMQIVEIHYQPNYVELILSSKIPNVSKRIEDINRNLVDSIAQDAPANPGLGAV